MKIPEIILIPNPESSEAKKAIGFKWAKKNIGKRFKVGGEPDWIQREQVPVCSCGKRMDFYGQLDSIGDDFCIADCGMIYVFICFDCNESKTVIQSG